MNEQTNETHRIQPITVISCIAISVLLFCRDALSIEISKTIFTAIILFTTFAINIPNMIYYMFFVFPLGIGLPSNYFIVFFLIKFAVNATIMQDDYRLGFKKTLVTLLLAILILVQNVIMGYTGMYHLSYGLGYLLFLYMTSYQNVPDIKKMLIFNIISFAIVAFIMFYATIDEYSFTSLIDGTYRFGVNAKYIGGTTMKIALDPNYLGFFALSSLTGTYIIIRKNPTFLSAMLLLLLTVFTNFVALVALSRAYVLVLIGFIALAMLAGGDSFKNSARNLIIVFVLAAIAYFAVKSFYPELLETILGRFKEDNVVGGNGRVDIIKEDWLEFTSSIVSFFFGVSPFETTVHCMPLQVLYGNGLLGAILTFLFYLYSFRSISINNEEKITVNYSFIPFIVIFVMSLTIPIVQSTVMMFPFITAMYACRLANE